MLNNGCLPFVVSNRLGHAKPSITMVIYDRLIFRMQKGIADLMDELTTPIEVDLKIDNCNIL